MAKEKQPDLLKQVGSPKFAVILLIILAVSAVFGTVIVQTASPEEYAARYGERTYWVLRALRLTDVYNSGWFTTVLILVCVNLIACSLTRFRFRLRRIGAAIIHWSLVLIAVGVTVSSIWGRNGMIFLEEGQSVCEFDAKGRDVHLGYHVRLDDFILELYGTSAERLTVEMKGSGLKTEYPVRIGTEVEVEVPAGESDLAGEGSPGGAPATYRLKVLVYIPDFVIADLKTMRVESRSSRPNNPAIGVSISGPGGDSERWLFARYPAGMHKGGDLPFELVYSWAPNRVKQFRSKLSVLEDGKVVKEKTISVNDPLKHRGFTFYQTTYDQQKESWSGLQVSRDPGVPFVYSGAAFLSIGLIMVFYTGPLLKGRGGARR